MVLRAISLRSHYALSVTGVVYGAPRYQPTLSLRIVRYWRSVWFSALSAYALTTHCPALT
eukprot:3610548-Rhodomonas_salina.1